MRVLFFVNSLKDGGAERVCNNLAAICVKEGYEVFFVNSLKDGGAERVCNNLAAICVKEGYEVDLVTLYKNTSDEEINSINHFCLELNRKVSKREIIKELLHKRKRVNRFIRENEMKGEYVLITAHLPLSHICASLSSKGNLCLYIQHTSLLSEGRYEKLYLFFYKKRMNVCVSKGLEKEFLQKMKYNRNKVSVIYNPLSVSEIRKKSLEPIEFEKPYMLCVGRLVDLKRFDRAIRIFYHGGFHRDYKLVILGQGGLKQKLEEQTKQMGIQDRVCFLGWKENVYAWMRQAELLYQTSDREALPMVLIEALASGTWVVAGNCSYGAEEILLGELSDYIAEYEQ